MKRALITALFAAVAFSSIAGTDAMAQPWGPDHRAPAHVSQDSHVSQDRVSQGWGSPGRHDRDARQSARHWKPGDRLPGSHQVKRHIIARPVAHRLHPPPAGHHWVRVNSDALLVAARTGFVVKVALNHFR